jgi:hypothetical protein
VAGVAPVPDGGGREPRDARGDQRRCRRVAVPARPVPAGDAAQRSQHRKPSPHPAARASAATVRRPACTRGQQRASRLCRGRGVPSGAARLDPWRELAAERHPVASSATVTAASRSCAHRSRSRAAWSGYDCRAAAAGAGAFTAAAHPQAAPEDAETSPRSATPREPAPGAPCHTARARPCATVVGFDATAARAATADASGARPADNAARGMCSGAGRRAVPEGLH